jgi:ribonuclease R
LIKESKEYYEGKIDMTGRKQPILFVELEDDVFIPTNNLNHA